MRLSVLDQIPVREGGTAQQAIDETLQLAEAVDGWGYHRYWLAEHHNIGSLACPAPEIMIPQVAAHTKRIRVGSGGVMLSHYAPLKVAECFRTLEAMFPGRIDLGIGRAPGSDSRTADALAHGPSALGVEHFPYQLLDLYSFLSDDFPPDHHYRDIRAMPQGVSVPQLWLLGSSNVSSQLAAQLGWAFSFAYFINSNFAEIAIREYRHNFQPSPMWPEPSTSLGVAVTCAETEEEAQRLAWSRWVGRVRSVRGTRGGGIPDPNSVIHDYYTEQELRLIEEARSRSVTGTPSQVRAQLEALAERHQVDELVILTITYDFAARLRSYELVADTFGLPRNESAAGR